MKGFLFLAISLAAPLSLAAAAGYDSSLPYRVNTCESDIDRLQKKQEELESQIDSLQSKLITLSSATDSSKGLSQQKLALTDSSIERLSKELTSLRDYSKTMSDSVNALQKKLAEIEQESKNTSAHTEKLEAALRSLTKLIQGQATANLTSPSESNPSIETGSYSSIYKVKSGDSLGKIAKANNTTISTLIKLNDLTPDAPILIGQELKLP
jgi:LysM repeat protein